LGNGGGQTPPKPRTGRDTRGLDPMKKKNTDGKQDTWISEGNDGRWDRKGKKGEGGKKTNQRKEKKL